MAETVAKRGAVLSDTDTFFESFRGTRGGKMQFVRVINEDVQEFSDLMQSWKQTSIVGLMSSHSMISHQGAFYIRETSCCGPCWYRDGVLIPTCDCWTKTNVKAAQVPDASVDNIVGPAPFDTTHVDNSTGPAPLNALPAATPVDNSTGPTPVEDTPTATPVDNNSGSTLVNATSAAVPINDTPITSPLNNPAPAPIDITPGPASTPIPIYKVGEFLAVVYKKKWYMGMVIKENEIRVSFMKESRGKFNWGKRDELLVSEEDILCKLSPPVKSGSLYEISIDDRENVLAAYAKTHM